MKKILSLLLIAALCLGLCASAAAEVEKKPWTIFVYLCGSDLESDSGLASKDLWEMIAATTKGAHYVVQTGGANS